MKRLPFRCLVSKRSSYPILLHAYTGVEQITSTERNPMGMKKIVYEASYKIELRHLIEMK